MLSFSAKDFFLKKEREIILIKNKKKNEKKYDTGVWRYTWP